MEFLIILAVVVACVLGYMKWSYEEHIRKNPPLRWVCGCERHGVLSNTRCPIHNEPEA
jgi:hypothetical protein